MVCDGKCVCLLVCARILYNTSLLQPSACQPLVNHVFITINNVDWTITNNGSYTLPDVRVGDVYVIEIVPSGALGNGSATVTSIGEFYTLTDGRSVCCCWEKMCLYVCYCNGWLTRSANVLKEAERIQHSDESLFDNVIFIYRYY